MKRDYRKRFWFNFVLVFCFVAISASINLVLFVNLMNIDEQTIRDNSLLVFGNVVLLALLLCSAYSLFRLLTVDRPVKKILAATDKLTQGDFSARIEKSPHIVPRLYNQFDPIADAVNHMAEELGSVETLRTDFISNVSHELKTPLAVIQNYSTLLQQPGLDEEKRLEYSCAITDASHRLTSLITNILKLNKLENQQIYPDKQHYNLGEQLCECFVAFENDWENKNLQIETDIDEEIYIDADKELLSLVWNNLLSNAVKFTESGKSIYLSLKSENGNATVTVKDTGCGMSEDIKRHIFEKFYQGDTSHATQGNGLGLALAKRVIDIMDGAITVESKPGEGSCFTVSLRQSEKQSA